VNALVVLPLYPQFSVSTSGSSLKVSSRCERCDYRTLRCKCMGDDVLLRHKYKHMLHPISADSFRMHDLCSCSC
jgi:hypothetical protein